MYQIDFPPGGDVTARLNERLPDINTALREDGAVLLRCTQIQNAGDFARVGQLLVDCWMPYQDRASKRSNVEGPILTSTDTPASFCIPQHSESAFTNRWPAKILFCCTTPAQQGGATPIADTRQVLASIDPDLAARFRDTGVMYVRNFSAGVGMDWRDVFQVASAEALEAYCEKASIALEWLADDAVRTTQVRPAISQHPVTGELVWFNHALALSQYVLDDTLREHLLRQVGPTGLPHNTFFGDGTPISFAQHQQLQHAHDLHTQRFTWQRGDLLLLDNMLCTHGRDPYAGERMVLAGLAEPVTWSDVGQKLAKPAHRPQFETPTPQLGRDADTETTVDLASFLTWVARQYTEVFELDPDLSLGFVDSGGDSVMAVELLDAANEEFDVDYSLDDFLDCDNVAEFFTEVLAHR